jgi:uncharacterized protein YciI
MDECTIRGPAKLQIDKGGAMPLYVMIGHDTPGAAEHRQTHRPAHLEGLEALERSGHLRSAGPMLDDDGNPMGSIVFFEAADLAAARALAAGDAYVVNGVFASHEVHETKIVLPQT